MIAFLKNEINITAAFFNIAKLTGNVDNMAISLCIKALKDL